MGAIEALLGWALGSVEGLATVVMLLTVGRWARRGAVVGEVFSTGGAFLLLLGVLALSGVVSIDVGALADFAGTALDLGSTLVGALPW